MSLYYGTAHGYDMLETCWRHVEEKKKLELQLLKINYDLSSNEITRKKMKK